MTSRPVFAEGFSGPDKYRHETNRGKCACGMNYLVSDQYSWMDWNSVLHGRKECKAQPVDESAEDEG